MSWRSGSQTEPSSGSEARAVAVSRATRDPKSVVEGKRVDLGGRRIIKKKKNRTVAVLSVLDSRMAAPAIEKQMVILYIAEITHLVFPVEARMWKFRLCASLHVYTVRVGR